MISLQEFIKRSPSPWHAVQTAIAVLKEHGFTQVRESEPFVSDRPIVYSRDRTQFIAYIPGTTPSAGFSSVQSHTDSPSLRILQNGELKSNGSMFTVPCEPYSGPVLSRWLDRPLQLAGQISYHLNGKLKFKLVHVDKFGFIPSLAPHMLRGTDQKDWVPENDYVVCTTGDYKDKMSISDFSKKIGEIPAEAVITAVNLEISALECTQFGNILQCPRLDNLASVYASIHGLVKQMKVQTPHTRMICGFNNEEVGSQTRAGAEGPFLINWWRRVSGLDEKEFSSSLARSFAASADGGHANHPIKGAGSCNDPVPVLGGGMIIKYGQKQNYAFTDHCVSVAKAICISNNIKFQNWIGRSYKMGGGTIGNIVAAGSDMNVVDCGIPMLGMHSCVETCDLQDVEAFNNYCAGILMDSCKVLAQAHEEMME
ncbi:Aspartyl_aminopeptidase [Hexamita inflata]|uniref:aspartyl aminopeptidase n=1 Tax=Hexamita inflata TaxID=28002 RepID=A0AA86QGI9_9EUKA|nr:Aspartyl aminopeptidase [Hexamita inflata]